MRESLLQSVTAMWQTVSYLRPYLPSFLPFCPLRSRPFCGPRNFSTTTKIIASSVRLLSMSLRFNQSSSMFLSANDRSLGVLRRCGFSCGNERSIFALSELSRFVRPRHLRVDVILSSALLRLHCTFGLRSCGTVESRKKEMPGANLPHLTVSHFFCNIP